MIVTNNAYFNDINKRLHAFLKNAAVKATYTIDYNKQAVFLVVNQHQYIVYFKSASSSKDLVANIKDTISVEFPILTKVSVQYRSMTPEEIADCLSRNEPYSQYTKVQTYQRFKIDKIQNGGKLIHGYDVQTLKPVFFRADAKTAINTVSAFKSGNMKQFLDSIQKSYKMS